MRMPAILSFFVALLFAVPTFAADQSIIVFDASGSMWAKIGNKTNRDDVAFDRETTERCFVIMLEANCTRRAQSSDLGGPRHPKWDLRSRCPRNDWVFSAGHAVVSPGSTTNRRQDRRARHGPSFHKLDEAPATERDDVQVVARETTSGTPADR